MILAIDTSAGTAVAVVDRDAGVLAERSVADTRRHAEVIGTLIDEALRAADVSPARLSAVVAGIGPGPYTGLRVGIAAARAFAFGAGIPSLSLGSHDAVAFDRLSAAAGRSVAEAGGPVDEPLVVVTDARRREVAWSTWSGLDDDGLPVRVEGPSLAKPADLDEVTGASSSWTRTDPDTVEVSAAALGMLAERLFEHGRSFADDQPLYLREPDVTPSAGPKPVGR
ncbi:tRNA (adenosine(37)-N6)-threonylcarbamoyltransferase complex dimerization subunit type 1 TsaB [Frigoribacterium sp. 2-23]|uniref:tRNA (adenosine(37)-N6)-threonylcarbamoyltransferase complex dimerization subunit type 1 TsaB n=1 Tax=Frigoribacterium sp. 2-23 TaxID=3415006 RepID=UPI003C6F537D